MSLEDRLDAVERTLTDSERGPVDLSGEAAREDRLDAAEDRLDDLEARVAELEAATQAIRGYVGEVRSVNRDVEETATAALAAAERVERRLDGEGSLHEAIRRTESGVSGIEQRWAGERTLESDEESEGGFLDHVREVL